MKYYGLVIIVGFVSGALLGMPTFDELTDASSVSVVETKPKEKSSHLSELLGQAPDGVGSIVRIHGKYVLGNNGAARQALWTIERLNPKLLMQNSPRKDAFRPDKTIGEEFRASNKDYLRSGYDKGHLAPSANHRLSAEDQRATFVLSNMSPQTGDFNRGIWRFLEAHVRDLAMKAYVVYCVTAPMYLPDKGRVIRIKTIGPNKVWVPTHYGKALLIKLTPKAQPVLIAWILPNEGSKLKLKKDMSFESFRVTTDQFERAAGIDVWARLPDKLEDRLEAKK